MSEKLKIRSDLPYFLTMTLEGWIDLFTRKQYAEFIEENLNICIDTKGLEVFEYCIMPSHVHLIVRMKKGRLDHWLRDFKGFTSRQMFDMISKDPFEIRREWLMYMFRYFSKPYSGNKEFKLWKNENHPEEIFKQPFYEQKMNYIHKSGRSQIGDQSGILSIQQR